MDDIDDSSILAVIADRATSPDTDPAEFTELLNQIRDPEARRVAEVLIRREEASPTDPEKVRQAVQGFRDWVRRNRTLHAPIGKSARSRR